MKKSQIQMLETIIVLFVFFVLVAFGAIFFTRIMRSNIAKDIEDYNELTRIAISQLALSLPEIQCSQFGDSIPKCVDEYKLSSAGAVISSNIDEYFDLFGNSKITIEKIFPDTETYTLYDNALSQSSYFTSYFPISLSDPVTKEVGFAVMVIQVYE